MKPKNKIQTNSKNGQYKIQMVTKYLHSIPLLKMCLSLTKSTWKPKIEQLCDLTHFIFAYNFYLTNNDNNNIQRSQPKKIAKYIKKYKFVLYIFILQYNIVRILKYYKTKMNKEDNCPILFYESDDYPQFFYLSNFYPSQFTLQGRIYKTSEHYYQSKKFSGAPQQLQIINAQTPGQTKKIMKIHKEKTVQNWKYIKEEVMWTALKAKFGQNKDLKQKLLQTGNRQLRQHTVKDEYWGDGGDKNTGKSRLGHLLMKLREQLKNGNII